MRIVIDKDSTICSYYGVDGSPCKSIDGFAKSVCWKSPDSKVEVMYYYDVDGTPSKIQEDGVYGKVVYKYDDRHNCIEESRWEGDELSRYGCARILYAYDELDNLIEESNWRYNGDPYLLEEGFCVVRSKYDDNNNIIERAAYGIDGKRCLQKDGISKSVREIDEYGNITSVAYYGIEDEPCTDNNGVHAWSAQYDKHGNPIEISWCDNMMNIVVRERRIYNQQGLLSEILTYDKLWKPTIGNDGVHKTCIKYDNSGNEVERDFYDTNNKLTRSTKMGCYSVRMAYDKHQNMVSISYYDANKKLCKGILGYSRAEIIYNDRHEEIRWKYYDSQQKLQSDNVYTYKIRTKQQELGYLIKWKDWILGDSKEQLVRVLYQHYKDTSGNIYYVKNDGEIIKQEKTFLFDYEECLINADLKQTALKLINEL